MAESRLSPETVSSKSSITGLVQVFTGNGKGKTSAAIGSVVRALGQGLRVCVVTFLKRDSPSGEWNVLTSLPNVTLARFGSHNFVDPDSLKPEDIDEAKKALAFARQAMLSTKYDLIVLDEVNIAVAWNLLAVEELVQFVKDRPPDIELILTGRYVHKDILELADLVTECLKVKHPFDKGIGARKGFEY